MRARRRERENPVIGGIDLPDDVWVALDRIETVGAASREQMDEVYGYLLQPDALDDRWRILVRWAEGLHVKTGPTYDARWAAIDRLLDLAHEHYDGLTVGRLVELRRHHGRPPLSPGWYRHLRTWTNHGTLRATVGDGARDLVAALRRYPQHPDQADGLLKLSSDFIGGGGRRGVESLHVERAWVSAFFQDIIALYVNMGDTYAPTVLYDTDFQRFMVTSWGDFMEQWEREHLHNADEGARARHRDDEEDT